MGCGLHQLHAPASRGVEIFQHVDRQRFLLQGQQGALLCLGFFQLFQKQGQAGVHPNAPIVILFPFINLPIQVIKRNSLALGQNLVQLIQLQNQTHLIVDGAVLLGLRQRSAALAQFLLPLGAVFGLIVLLLHFFFYGCQVAVHLA